MTLQEFLELPEEKPALKFEPDGTVAQKMSPRAPHRTLQFRLAAMLNAFAEARQLAFAFPELRTIFGGAAMCRTWPSTREIGSPAMTRASRSGATSSSRRTSRSRSPRRGSV